MKIKFNHKLIEMLALISLLIFILLLRKPDAFLNPQLWAEDGAVFLVEQREQGSNALLNEYVGYYHLIPRLIASFSSFFPLENIPAVYNFSAVLCTAVSGLLIRYARVDLGVPKFLLAVSIVLIPNSGEILVNLTNVQWFLAIAIPFLILQRPPESWRQGVFDAIVVFLIGMTGPFLLVAAPLLTWRVIQYQNRRIHLQEIPFYVCAGLSILLQAHSVLLNQPEAQAKAFVLSDWLHVCFFKFGSYLYFGKQLPESLPLLLSIFAAFFLVLTISTVFLLEKQKQQAVIIFLVFGMIVFLASLVKSSRSAGGDTLAFHPFLAGGRYYFLPFLAIFYTHLTFIYSTQRLRWIGYVGVILILLSSATAFSVPPFADFHWEQYVQQSKQQKKRLLYQSIHPGKSSSMPLSKRYFSF